jgi:hypothetical protein
MRISHSFLPEIRMTLSRVRGRVKRNRIGAVRWLQSQAGTKRSNVIDEYLSVTRSGCIVVRRLQ